MTKRTACSIPIGIYLLLSVLSCADPNIQMSGKIELDEQWLVKQSVRVNLPGSVISGKVLDTETWYKGTVPSTIMGVLLENGLFPDIFMADSLSHINRDQFNNSWWYRTEFEVPELKKGQHAMLCFDGISYYANIWLNSTLIAASDSVYGTYRTFRFDVTSLIKESSNVLAVEVFKRKPGDFGHGFVDWNPKPPDESMGLWRGVYVDISGDVAIANTFVRTDALSENLDEASLSVITELVNYADRTVSGNLVGKSKDFEFSVPVRLKSGEHKTVSLGPSDVRSLRISDPELWWCNNMGKPALHTLNLQFIDNKKITDDKNFTFGIRKIGTYMTQSGHKGFILNGEKVLVKGGGWTDDIFLRDTPEKNEIQVQYAKHMNLNTIRFENFWGTSQNIYDLCDKYGLLVMIGWSCQWEWDDYLGKPCDDFGGITTEKEMDLMVRSLGDQIRVMQNHPSVFVWLVGSDKIPRPALEARYRDLIGSMDDRPYLASASSRNSTVSGPTGMKMNGPYEYVTPVYWYIDSVHGGAFGFNTETGPGLQVPVKETLMKMIPENKLWPVNDIWNYHCTPAKEAFNNFDVFGGVMQQRYGKPGTLDNFLIKSDVQGYEAMKGMFEAFRVNRPNTTGIIQWMLNSAWPNFYWHLYDYYLLPTSAYYATRKANEPVQLIYNYGNHQLFSVNESHKKYEKARARIRLADLGGRIVMKDEQILTMDENSSKSLMTLPAIKGTMFLSVDLYDAKGNLLADNFYWLTEKEDVYDWPNSTWYYTPLKASADFRSLNNLPATGIDFTFSKKEDDNGLVVEATILNNSNIPAFFIGLTLKDAQNNMIFPVFWEDNYISLLPGDERKIGCVIPVNSGSKKEMNLTISGWNVKEQTVKIE